MTSQGGDISEYGSRERFIYLVYNAVHKSHDGKHFFQSDLHIYLSTDLGIVQIV